MSSRWFLVFAILCGTLSVVNCTSLCRPGQPCFADSEWPDYRHDVFRTGNQPNASALSDPQKVQKLKVQWVWPSPTASGVPQGFEASPIVVNDTVLIGSKNGYFFAIDVKSGKLKWQYPTGDPLFKWPPPGSQLLHGFVSGIQSSASYLPVGDGAVVFGAQDDTLGPYNCGTAAKPAACGSSRLFAVDINSGKLIWKSDRLAEISGDDNCPSQSSGELHEKLGHSSPLVLGSNVYVGVSDANDNPIQPGRVQAVDANSGHLSPGFAFVSEGLSSSPLPGGGVWNGPATDTANVYFTTGNTYESGCGWNYPEPVPNYGISMVQVNPQTGKVGWSFQPVKYTLDNDDDWAAGAAVDLSSCGELIPSVMKDGFVYAVNASTGTAAWQFPEQSLPPGTAHEGHDYFSDGALWNDVFVVSAGGEDIVAHPKEGHGYLQALNVCAQSEVKRVRWILRVPDSGETLDSLGAPVVSGGIFYVGTNEGHLVAIADPTIAPAAGQECSNWDLDLSACTAPATPVPVPTVLSDIAVSAGSLAELRDEPALANGRIIVASSDGHVYMLSP